VAGQRLTKILVVDDDPQIGVLLAGLLEGAGYIPLIAGDAVSAAVLFDEEWPDLVILDVGLGHTSGLDLLQRFKQQRGIPIVLLSGLGSEEARLRGFDVGADDYMTKPFGNQELLARIHAKLRRAGQA
jgi:DNA-binding response OmpR family regulator